MDLKKLFDEEMHGGPQIQGMQRRNGCYIDQKDDDSLYVLFDTGNLFIIRGSDVVQRIDANDEYFIDKQVIKSIYAFIDLNPAMKAKYDYSQSNYSDNIEFYRIDKNSKSRQRSTLIRFSIDRDLKRIMISNILIPLELKHCSYGKGIINEIYKIAKSQGYQLLLEQLVQSFYDRLVARGAKIIVTNDIVEIIEATNLI